MYSMVQVSMMTQTNGDIFGFEIDTHIIIISMIV